MLLLWLQIAVAQDVAPEDEDLAEITVVARDVDEVEIRISGEDLRATPGTLGDPIRAIETMPGVARSSFIDGQLVVRGAEGSMTKAWVDGLPVPFLFHAIFPRSVISPANIEGFEFLPGGMPVRYGFASQGALDTQLRSVRHGFHGAASIDFIDGAFAGAWRAGKWDGLFSGRYSWIGALAAGVTYGATQGEGSVNPGYFDFVAKVGVDLNDHRLEALAIGAGDFIRVAGDFSSFDEESVPYDPNVLLDRAFYRTHLRWLTWSSRWEQMTLASYGAQNALSIADTSGFDVTLNLPPFGKIQSHVATVRHQGAFRFGNVQLQEGVDFRYERYNAVSFADFVSPDVPLPEDKGDMFYLSPWLGTRIEGSTWYLTLGMRGSWHRFQDRDYGAAEPRVNLLVEAGSIVDFTAFAGGFSQSPASWKQSASLGNPNLEPVRNWQAGAGVMIRPNSHFEIQFQAWGSYFQSIVQRIYAVEVETRDPADPVARQWIDQGFDSRRGYSVGGDAFFRWNFRKFRGWLSVTGGRSIRLDDGNSYPSDFDQPLGGNLVGIFLPGKMWELSGRLQLTAGQPYTPVEGQYDPFAGGWDGAPKGLNSARYPMFFQLDLRFSKTFPTNYGRAKIYLDILNATNTRNPLGVIYSADYRRQVGTIWLPIVPSLGVEMQF